MIFRTFDQDYVTRLTQGDPVAESEFAAYFGRMLTIKLRARHCSPESVDDIKQETLFRVLRILRQKGGVEHPERFGAFVNSVCNNVLLESFRKTRESDPLDEAAEIRDPSIDLDASLISTQRKKLVEEILDELSEKDRDLLRLVFLEEEDRTEVCRRFNTSTDNLRLILHRARCKFRKIYARRAGVTG